MLPAMKRRRIIFYLVAPAAILLFLFLGYAGWNAADPQRTCASCHEIVPSFEEWQLSAHREVGCAGCHGTALGNGFHSLKEKSGMLFSHLARRPYNEEIRLDEKGVLEVMEACTECHASEYRNWLAGGHSATYADIFLDEFHNSREQPYWDCLRCHGMFYDGTIYELVEPVSTTGPWKLKEEGAGENPVIPCLACHGIHQRNEPLTRPENMDDPAAIHYLREARAPAAGLHVRSDGMFLRADLLPEPDMYDGGRAVLASGDPLQRTCIQCHAPGWNHATGSSDDRTPTGVHEGISCMACHLPHSNEARASCRHCHPALSNCGLDVETMNTTFLDRDSPHNIHFVACEDCHEPVPERR
jgi:hypothetical protein